MSSTYKPQLKRDEEHTLGQRLADAVTHCVGSWRFVLIQSFVLLMWVVLNTAGWFYWKWDIYPFILMNLFLSLQAAYTGPLVLISQNRQEAKDRTLAKQDFENNVTAKEETIASKMEIESMLRQIKEIAVHLDEQDALILAAVTQKTTTKRKQVQP